MDWRTTRNHYLEQSQHLFHPNAPVNGSLSRRNLRLRYELKVFSVRTNVKNWRYFNASSILWSIAYSYYRAMWKPWNVSVDASILESLIELRRRTSDYPLYFILFAINIWILLNEVCVMFIALWSTCLETYFKNLLISCLRYVNIHFCKKGYQNDHAF